MADPVPALNPKAVLRKRMADAGEGDDGDTAATTTAASAVQPAASAPQRFTREWTPAQRAEQQKRLAAILRARGD